ncbi:T9SS type A sorting domain-containing protein [Chryseobacterium sp. PET-29]|uniref:T9SS type A sorting domain-containing protein n=2 Tax=unclassified Chryseobacterium TaxID=2593645 RepID=UPI0021E5DBD4|nr:T9SS type A sorting domain-containing protein [Chryseobacterium sp. PET-29]
MKNFYSTIRTLAKTVVIMGASLLGYAQAQTTLSPGGIAFTSYDSSSTSVDVFSFVLLAPISSGTQISFTDRGYQGSNAWQAAGSTESAITWTSGTALPAGTEVYISALSASVYNPATSTSIPNGTVALTDGTSSNGLVLSSVGDQIIAFQGGNGSVTGANVTCIAGINYFYTAGSTTAAWNSDAVGSPNASLMPPGLTGGTNAFYTGPVSGVTVARSGKFNCTGVPTSTVANIRTAVMNNANWTLSTAAGSQYSGCTFLASNPVITASPANRTICAGGTTTFTVAASGASSYQWYQNSGSGFIALTNTAPYSGVTTNTLTITGATSAMNGYQYRAVAIGSGSATSNAATLTVVSISTTGSKTDVSCNGGSNGVATVVPSGGVAPYTYSWAPFGGTAATATGLSAGTYTVTVTDNLGCQSTRTFTIDQPASAVSGTTVVTNVACNGASNGAINLTPAGGTAPYTFNWGGGITTEDRTGLAAGTYTVIITDANGCTATVNATVTQPASAVSGTTVVTNVACNGASNGAINLTPAGGTAPYTFNWGGGITTEDRTGLAAGTYTVIITDANGCTATVNATVTQPASAVSGTTVVTNVACNGASNGAINLTPAGGTAPYTFNWGGGITTEDRTGLAAGTYTVIITDANGCTATVNATVTQPASAVSGTTVVTNVACNGASNGAINLTPAGGTAPYTFNWGGGITTEDRTGLAAGTYTVTITDANGCTATVNATVTQPASAVSGTTVVTNVACNGASNGAINLTPAGGTAPYTFNWGGGITTEDRTGLAAGTYTVTITDANGCTATVSRTVTQPTALSATTSQTNIACNGGSTGVATVNVSGGTAPYTYSWSPSGGTAATATGLSAGTYTVTVTDANACTLTRTFTITQPTALSATTSQTNIACNGGSTGVATVNVSGGTAPYTYSWSPSGGTAATATGLSAGTYTVTVTDANACTLTRTFTITQPTALSATTSQTNIACNGGSTGVATVNVSGGTAPYTYSWSPSGGTAATATGLSAGTYTVTVTDANACTLTRTFTITQPTALSATTSQTNIACNGGSTGVATVNVSGGTAPYTYSWSPSGGTAATATGLSAGTYTVTVTDANACTLTRTFTITQPTALSATTSQTNIACNGGSTGVATVNVSGGTAPYTYSWSPSGGTAATATGLSAGTYTVTVTSANGCTLTRTFTITQPASAVSGTTVVTNVACNGASNGAINLTPAGGTAPYTFNWGGGITTEDRTGLAAGTYTVIITDANGCTATVNATVTQPASAVSGTTVVTNVACNGASNGAINLTPAGGTAPYTFNWGGGITTEDRTGLAAGTYTVIITDANGCTATVNATVTQPASAVSGTTVVTNVACNGASNGAINLTPAGGTAPYTFNWGGGITTEDRTGLAAGTYTVIITDANGCTATVNATVTQPASAVSGTTVVTNVACNGASNGAINLTPAGGTAPYTFNWGGGITTEDRTGLAAGTYTVIITDANGCTATVSRIVTQPTALSATTSQTNIACNGGSTGVATVNVSGGTAPYTYSWSPSGGTAATATGLSAGTYTVTVTDANACTLTRTFTITQPTALSATTSQTNIACNGGSTGVATVNVSGGTAPYTYSWSPSGGTAATATGLSAGTYTVTVTDANACTLTRTFTITQSAPVAAPTGTSPQNFAPGSTLSALVVTGQNIKWYASSSDAQNHVNSLPLSTALVHNTTYYATQTVGSCESIASLAVVAINTTLGVADNTKTKSQLQIYPNPVRDILNFSGQEVITKAVIFAADGRRVTEKKLQSGERSIDVHALPQGVYLIQVFTDNGMQTFKFIKK